MKYEGYISYMLYLFIKESYKEMRMNIKRKSSRILKEFYE